jgi:hypothetical protein
MRQRRGRPLLGPKRRIVRSRFFHDGVDALTMVMVFAQRSHGSHRGCDDAALEARRNAQAMTAYALGKWSALRPSPINVRIGPLPVWMPDVYPRSIEPPIAILLSIGYAIALPAIAALLGRFLPRLGPLVATQAAFLFVCPPIGSWGPLESVRTAGTARRHLLEESATRKFVVAVTGKSYLMSAMSR